MMEQGIKFATMELNDGKISDMDEIRINRIDGVKYIKTDHHQMARDYIGELPEF
jgi:hypothetical protein